MTMSITVSAPLHARENRERDKLPEIEFSIKPRLCVLSDGEEQCDDMIEVTWTSDSLRSICLYQSDKTLPLRCWENEYTGSHSFVLNAKSNIDFYLQDMAESDPIVSQAFEVVHDNSQYRRRRRNPWSFF